ncbi:DUF6825 family protein [Synechococcus sp. PCC 7336]|uniref:DUF6825 family protein n=1 Tax=Synechococcus sp. PCC 7336 TaxID=195250 RepID=UPI000348ED2B|nr:hypothetical protein [Synechococcus sp. PCC 7336]
MSNPLTRAFFLGRATANLLAERAEGTLSDLASDLGKVVAEAQQQWEQFGEDVLARATEEEAKAAGDFSRNGFYDSASGFPSKSSDLQATLDELRAEVAQLRSELQTYRSQSA